MKLHSKRRRRIVIIADVHLSNRLPYSSGRVLPDGRTGRFVDQLKALAHVREFSEKNEVDEVFILGDLFDKSSIDGFALFDVLRELRGFPPITIIPGNHDAETVRGGRYGTKFLAADEFKASGIEYVEEPTVRRYFDWLSFYLVPFRSIEQNREDIDQLRAELRPANKDLSILMFHNSIIGAKHYGWECDRGLDAGETCEGFDAVFAGHFHARQEFAGGSGTYVGGLIPLDFRDAVEIIGGVRCASRGRGFAVVDFQPKTRGGFRITFEKIPAPKFYIAKSLVDLGHFRPGDDDFLKIQIRATATEWISLRPEVELAADRLREKTEATVIVEHVLDPEGEVRLDSVAGGVIASWEELVAEYVDRVAGHELDPELLKDIGAEALEAAGEG